MTRAALAEPGSIERAVLITEFVSDVLDRRVVLAGGAARKLHVCDYGPIGIDLASSGVGRSVFASHWFVDSGPDHGACRCM